MEKIKLYLDWGIINSLEKDEFSDIRNFINEHKDLLFIPYSESHLDDLKKSCVPNNDDLEKDLDRIINLSGGYGINWENNGFKIEHHTLDELLSVIKTTKDNYDIVKCNSTYLDKDRYKDMRKDYDQKLDSNHGDWPIEDVVDNINATLQKNGQDYKIQELILNNTESNGNELFRYSAGLMMLDMIGYMPDKLKKTSNDLTNVTADARHLFYSTYCDYFVVMDKRLRKKAQVLFHIHKTPTKIIGPDEFVNTLKSRMNINT